MPRPLAPGLGTGKDGNGGQRLRACHLRLLPHLGAVSRLALFLTCVVLSGCQDGLPAPTGNSTDPAAPRSLCASRPRGWIFVDPASQPVPTGGLNFSEVAVGPDGGVTWNLEPVDTAGLRANLEASARLFPIMPVVLRSDRRSPCPTLEHVRRLLDASAACRGGACIEASAWEARGYPSFRQRYGL